jgi:hypothetical protein
MIAVILDAASEPTYQKIHKNSPAQAFQTGVNAVALLQNAIPGSVLGGHNLYRFSKHCETLE